MEDAERSHILQTLQQTEGVVGGPNGAAARLGLCRTTLISKMKRLGIILEKISVSGASSSVRRPNSPDPSAACNRSLGREFSKSNPHSDKGRAYAMAEA